MVTVFLTSQHWGNFRGKSLINGQQQNLLAEMTELTDLFQDPVNEILNIHLPLQ